jgi:exonuclease VII small subunit/ribosomal protein L7Ae-like RNA K-turn-binding protein
MPILTLIPLETKIAILVLVILPAIAVFLLRISLYKKLEETNNRISRLLVSGEEEGIQPEIVKRLRNRYQKASQKLEHVNTLALIDSIYKDERVSFLGFRIQFDRADGITRALPNLLIAFGLIGTFLGITSNLTNISTIVTGFSQSNPDISGLVQGLQKPLQDMGTAFSASLFGLLFGSMLTIANTIWNTSIAKYQLISSLEDYLDNIYKPTVEGNTRLDTAIDRMVDAQQQFLLRFHENVGRVLETSFGRAANQIAEECGRINQIAENVYTNFSNAAGTIATGASTFQQAATSLESQTKNLADSLHGFKSGVETFKIAANQIENNNIIQNLDRVLAELNTSQQAFATSTTTLQDSLIGITTSNQTAAQLAQQVYQTWQDSATQIVAASETIGAGAIIFQKSTSSLEAQTQTFSESIPQLKAGLDTFVVAANKVKTNNIIKHLNSLVENLGVTQSAFTSSTQTLSASVDGIMSSHQQATQIAEQVYQGLEQTTNSIQSGANKFISAAQIIRDSSLATDLTKVANQWQNAQSEFTNSTAIFSQASKNLQPVTAKLEPAIASIDRAVNSLQQVGSEVVSLNKNNVQVSASTQNAIDGFNRNCLKILNNTDLSIQDIGTTNKSNWQSLVNILEPKIQTDRESLQRLVTVIEKLEKIVSNIDSANSRDRSSGLQGRSQSN